MSEPPPFPAPGQPSDGGNAGYGQLGGDGQPGDYGQPAPPWGGPAQAWGGPAQAWGGPASGSTDGQAIAALVCGIAGLFVCPVVISIVAIVLGTKSRRRIDASGGVIAGRGLATAGFILGIVGVVLGVVALLFFVGTISGSAG